MLPTTLTGVALFIVLLLPGLAFTLVRERHRPIKKLSAFRETALVAFVSAIPLFVALALILVISFFIPVVRDRIDFLVQDPSGFTMRFPRLALAAAIFYLLLATILGALTGGSRANAWYRKQRKTPDPANSAWWLLFENLEDREAVVSVNLEDGSWMSGVLYSWSRDSDETGDRELTLRDPLRLRPPGEATAMEMNDVAAVAVSARRIVYLTVQYRQVEPASPVS